MSDVKSLFKSVTFWSSAMVIVGSLAQLSFGDIPGFSLDIVSLIGAAGAVYGRIKAVKKIG